MRRRKLPPPGGPIAMRKRKLELEEHEPPPVDLISTLPDELLGEIICLLPITDAARTQILASRWRRLWRSTPLNLDCCQLFSVNGGHRSKRCPSLVLSAHPGPGRRFCLTTDYSMTTPTVEVEHWLRSAALDNLQELEFAGAGKPVPASIFCRFAHTLRVANIRDCTLESATLQGLHFPQLKQLGLERVGVSEPSLHRLIAGCPAIELLLILSSSGFQSLRINSLSLRRICMRTTRSIPPQFGELVIENAPHLESLSHMYNIWDLGDLSIHTAPKVDALDFLADLEGFRQCTKVETLILGRREYVLPSGGGFQFTCISFLFEEKSHFTSPWPNVASPCLIKGLFVNNPATVVRNVRSLSVNMGRLVLDNIVRLMRLFPSLEELHVKSGVSSETNWWRRRHKDFTRCHDIRLKIVVLETYQGTSPHVNLATFFLLNARMLELMTFHIEASVYSDEFLAEQRRRLQLDKRASRGARFRFTTASCQHAVWSTNHLREFDLNDDPFTSRC